MERFPVSYKDPTYDSVDSSTEQKLGIPAGLLSSIRLYGEKSNADQVSSAGARTPYQITPSTRKLILKKYGIDPYLSPELASEGAGLLLQESLKRNADDIEAAVGEYHGGTDRKNWGAVNKAYRARVVPKADDAKVSKLAEDFSSWAVENPAPEASGSVESDFGAWLAQQKPEEAPKLPPTMTESAAEMVTGAERTTPESEAATELGSGVDIRMLVEGSGLDDAGIMRLGADTLTATNPEEAAAIIEKQTGGVVSKNTDEKGNIFLKNNKTGQEVIINKPGLSGMDAFQGTFIGGLAALATMPAGRVAQATGGGLLATGLAGGALSAAGQAGIEAEQASQGGTFDKADIAVAGAIPVALPFVAQAGKSAINAMAPKVMQGVNTVKAMGSRGAQAIPEAAPVGAGTVLRQADDVAQAVDNVAPAVPDEQIAAAVPDKAPVADIPASTPVQELSEDEFVALVRQADGGVGSQKAKERLAQSIPMNAEMKDIAEKYGYDLPIDVVSDSENLRQAMGGVRGIKLSPESIKWGGVKADVIDKTENLIQQLDGAKSVSEISEKVQLQLSGTQKALSQQTKSLYNDIEKAVPPNTPVSIPKTREVADQIIADRGEYVSPKIKEIAKMASDPKLTYAAAKDLKGEIGDVMSGAASKEPYGSTQVGQLKQLYKALADDQLDAVEGIAGTDMRDKLRLANTLTSQKKRLEKRIISGYGKDAEGGIGGKLTKAIKSGSSGDVTQLNKMIALLPPENRKEAIMSGIFSVVRDAKGKLSHEKFESFYGSLRKQTPIYSKIAKELTPDHEEFLRSFYVLSKKMNAAENAVDKTGRANQLLMKMQAETITEKILASAGGQVATRAAGAVIPNPIMNTAINALTTAPSDKLLAAGKLLASPEFEALVVNPMKTGAEPSKAAIKKLAMSKVFSDFIKSVNMPRDLTAREKYITAMLQGGKGSVQETDQKGEF